MNGTSDNVASSASPSTGSSSPASSGSTGNVTSGTASEAMIKAATAASSAEGSAPTGAAPAGVGDTSGTGGSGTPPPATGTTAQPPSTDPAAQPAASGQAPEHRITAAVKNARAEVIRNVENHLGFRLNEVDPKTLRASIQLYERLQTPEGIRGLLAELQAKAGVTPGNRGGGEEAGEEYPAADLVSPDGSQSTYSAKTMQKALAVHGKKVEAAILDKLGPALSFLDNMQDERGMAERRSEAQGIVKETLTHARSLQHFKEHEPAIMAKMKSYGKRTIQAVGPIAAMYMAYNAVLHEAVYPTLEQTIEGRVRESFSKKAASTVSAPIGSVGGEGGKRPELRNVTDLAKHMEKMAEAV